MTISQDEYAGTAHRVQDAWTNAADVWTKNIEKFADHARRPLAPVVPEDLTPVVEQWYDFAGRLHQANREYALSLAGVADTITGAIRQHVETVGGVVRDQVLAVSSAAKEQTEKIQHAQKQLTERADEVERELGEDAVQEVQEAEPLARTAERRRARQAR